MNKISFLNSFFTFYLLFTSSLQLVYRNINLLSSISLAKLIMLSHSNILDEMNYPHANLQNSQVREKTDF